MPPSPDLYKRVLIVTPTLGKSPWLADTVASVENAAPGCRHILVAPLVEVPRLAQLYPQTEVIAEKGPGLYAAINLGLAHFSDWSLFSYINDDDLLLPNFSTAMERTEAIKSPVIGYGNIRLINAKSETVGHIPVSRFPSCNRDLYAQRLEPVYQHGTLFNRAAMDILGGFDENFRLCGDSEILARASVHGIKFEYIEGKPLAAFRLQAGQLTKNRAAMVQERHWVDEKLGLLKSRGPFRLRVARMIFRASNAAIYFQRVRRHGWKKFDEVLESVE